MSVTLHDDITKVLNADDIDELHKMLFRIKVMEEQAAALLSRLEKK
jgi:hypothetical protein